METLAERTERLLKHVEDWPLGVATDYLIEHGCNVLEGAQVLGRGRGARLKRRMRVVAREMIEEPLQNFEVREDVRGARVMFWWSTERASLANALSASVQPSALRVLVMRTWREGHYYTLPEWCQASAGEFAEHSLCDLFVLLWALARCYAGDG